jgi:hypothetical protein
MLNFLRPQVYIRTAITEVHTPLSLVGWAELIRFPRSILLVELFSPPGN